ncbi:N-succinylarginine dihydrolase [Sphingomonas sabuli]|uniref:N-succinylarginine dihydrolase n=1 Tax=Sphingomonas sabuli TaxID=2764186 RepID=A0A7G9L1Z8_9SPHN|nr:N-succinylarginine dihydrolase [Sphingomonas sabuli]QNM82647.1 N-succinylarginine dihydrolase [Sphingomonas sabuli]
MPLREINFDGIVGPSHNYAGLSLGNLASTRNARQVSQPRAAALEGVEKMRANLQLGLAQGIFLPHPRPDRDWLARLGTTIEQADDALAANAMSASAMWAANAATVSPAPDTGDGTCHLTVANLRTMPHRSHEWQATLAQLQVAFADRAAFTVHGPVPGVFGDEGAANHMRLCASHGESGVEVFVYGRTGGAFPARQHIEACKAIARFHQLDPERTIFAEQSPQAIEAGAFHNDVVAVANERVLFAHEQAFADRDAVVAGCERLVPGFELVEVSAADVPIADAVTSYLFNAQLVSPPDGEMTLIVPSEARETPSVWAWLQRHLSGNGPIRKVEVVDVRQSMANGGGPACLRLRVLADPATVDPRFMVDAAKLDRIAAVIEAHWPQTIGNDGLRDPALVETIERARLALLNELDLAQLA